ncbi:MULTISPECIES: hypothetical protein [unclassified Streptomyces]|uniref:hypothetical protein n=1 Tax=unclassified Streptomyces TaxID=2593676 RepID=UPI00225803E9|nr:MULTISPECIES: hypothetical protein [unclassified Streptomyces]MCX5049693.1 hypothetical protein [Streptomyces sp. NBC_00474]
MPRHGRLGTAVPLGAGAVHAVLTDAGRHLLEESAPSHVAEGLDEVMRGIQDGPVTR